MFGTGKRDSGAEHVPLGFCLDGLYPQPGSYDLEGLKIARTPKMMAIGLGGVSSFYLALGERNILCNTLAV